MHLEDAALCVNQWECPANLIGRTEDRRYNPLVRERRFHETVKVRSDYDSHESLSSKRRDGAVRSGRLFLTFLALPFVRFPIRTQ